LAMSRGASDLTGADGSIAVMLIQPSPCTY